MYTRKGLCFVASLMMICGCDGTSNPLGGPSPFAPNLQSGQIQVVASFPKLSTARVRPEDVASMTTTISWDGGATAPMEMFETSEQKYQVTVLNLPAGVPTDVEVVGKNQAGDTIYSGTATDVVLSASDIISLNVILTSADTGINEGEGPAIATVRRPTADVLANSIINMEVDVRHPDDASLDFEFSGPGQFAEATGTIDLIDGEATINATYTAPSAAGEVTLTIQVTDGAGLAAEVDFTLNIVEPDAPGDEGGVTIGTVFPPAILGINAEQDPDGGVVRLHAIVQEQDGALPLTFDWRTASTTFSTDNPAEYPIDQGVVEIELAVSNSAGGTTSIVFDVDTSAATLDDLAIPNRAPTIAAALMSQPEASYPDTVTLRVYAQDPNDDTLSAAWSTDHGTIGNESDFADGDFDVFEAIWEPAVTAGQAEVRVTIADPAQASVIYTFNINQVLGRVPVTADAGPDQEVFVGAETTLDGSASTSGDSVITSYSWEIASGPNVTIHDPTSVTTQVTFDGGAGTYVFLLTATNVNNSDYDTVIVNVVDPFAFDYTAADFSNDGVIYFFNAAGMKIHRYDAGTESFLPNLTVDQDAYRFAVAPAGDTIYVGYTGGRIDQIDTATGDASLFTSVPTTASLIKVIDKFVWTIDGSGSWKTHRMCRRSNGEETFSDLRYGTRDAVFSPVLSRVFHFRDGISPNDLIRADVDLTAGTLGPDVDSPYHGDFSFQHPMRLNSDESKIMVANGTVFSTSNLNYVESTGYSYTDARFHGVFLYLLQSGDSGSQVLQLDSSYNVTDTFTMTGTPRSLFVVQGKLVVVTEIAGDTLQFTIIPLDYKWSSQPESDTLSSH